MRVAGFVSDIDRTLVSDQARIDDPEIRELLAELGARNVLRVLNSGRTLDYIVGPGGISDQRLLNNVDVIIGGGGGSMLNPRTGQVTLFGPPYSAAVVWNMRRMGVSSRVIWARDSTISSCWEHDGQIQESIRRVNRLLVLARRPLLDLVGTRNGDTVVYLPRGVDKGTSMLRVLATHGIDPASVVGAGDGWNDVPFLSRVGLAIVPPDAHPALLALPNAVVAPLPGPPGVKFVLRELLAGRIPGWSVGPPLVPDHGVAS